MLRRISAHWGYSEATPWQRISLAALCAFLLSPLALQFWMSRGEGPLDLLFVFNVATSLLWITLLHLLVRRPLMLHLALAPLYVTTAIDLFLVSNFKARLSSSFVDIALTNASESAEFMLTYARPVALTALVLLVIYLPCLYGIRHMKRQRSPLLALIVASMLVAAYGAALSRDLRLGFGAKQSIIDIVGKEMGAPEGPVFQTALALHLHQAASKSREQRESFSFGASKKPSGEGEVYLFVVGESSRPQDWSLFGYSRDTTPRLRATPGIVGLPHMLTTAPYTAVAVPSMLSLRPITDWPSVVAEKSIVSAFNDVGFKTYWLSTQEVDSWGGIIPLVAAEAKNRRYFDRRFDSALLDEVRGILRDSSRGEKLFIVLHTKGSHFEYARRYPPEFARFASPGGSRHQQLVDVYDNTVLYTDWFLSELINTLSQRGGASALFYSSDHGENLLDDEKQLVGHAIGNRYDLPAAAFVWLSQDMRSHHPEQAQALQRNAATPLSLSNLPHSVLDLAGISAKGLDPQMSLFSPSFTAHRRWYLLGGQARESVDGARLPP